MTASPTPQRPGRLGALDTLRLVAAVSVMAFHFTAVNSPAWQFGILPQTFHGVGRATAYGTLGVPLFFVISGFVMLMTAWGRDVPGFVASRVGRLYPAYWAAVAISLVIVVFLWRDNAWFQGFSHPDALLNFTMFQETFGAQNLDKVYWTLSYEARFYVLVAVLMAIGMTRARLITFAALWPVAAAIAQQMDSQVLVTVLMPDFAPFFAGGMLLYLIYRDGHDLFTWLLVGFEVVAGAHQVLPIYMSSLDNDTPFAPSATVIALLIVACFGLVALTTLTRVASWNARWMTVAGALTYPLYLVHENLGWYVIHLLGNETGPWVAAGAAVACAVAAALALHHLVEKPLGPRLRAMTLRSLRSTTARVAKEREPAVVRSGSDARDAAPAVQATPAPAYGGVSLRAG